PTSGGVWKIGGEMAIPPASQRYFKASIQHQRYMPIARDVTLAVNGEFGIANGFGGRDLPFFKNFYAGGIGSVRGFEGSSLGPIDATTGERLGGTKRLVANVEVLFPMPGSGLDRSVRLGAFVDAGQVWGQGDKASLGNMRYSAGVSLAWNSPLGPLKFSLGNPLNKKPEDKLQRLQFQMGSTF
ncbi:MAG: BamA/TamA family outer membrane protein, partial [Rhodocyclaceae bacterium]|nr:BamA/TamA family outer membrane protein [Rhodocyclaceae bacterium]